MGPVWLAKLSFCTEMHISIVKESMCVCIMLCGFNLMAEKGKCILNEA